jgi:predicted extracellular nuclease
MDLNKHMNFKSLFLFLLVVLFFYACSSSQKSASKETDQYARIVFYNVENLFDTINSEEVNDSEYTPESDKKWNAEKYADKLNKLSKVIASADSGYFPDLLGLCEIENKGVVSDLISTPDLQKQKYSILHQNSPDKRGIDVALVYTKQYTPLSTSFILIDLPGNRSHTRDILYSKGILYKDTIHVFVNHWPSRYGGKEISDPKRAFTAQVLRNTIDSIQKADLNPQIIIMGDFNDYPPDSSLSMVLGAKASIGSDPNDLVNLAWETNAAGAGSYNYKGDWGTLDQFILSSNLFEKGKLTADLQSYQVVKKNWMLYTDKKGNQSPSRSYGGDNYYGGYSDHLPILLKLKVNK